ncbi:MAG: hypothetical protein JWM28_928, partial [Chitinophagaceae bacterium]|nr:hypothetical protein [Chitinophagaceae bacterium]
LPTEEQVRNSLASALSSINRGEGQSLEKKAKIISISRLKLIAKIAAIFIVIAVTAGVINYNYWNAKDSIATKYGEIKNIVLPDGSQVILNAHSSISYFKHVKNSRPRQVWLDGEAFFDVKHINKDENNIKVSDQFIVATSDLNVHVLGTSFDVKKRDQLTEVVLETGKIRIEFNNKSQPAINMLPGQIIAYDETSRPTLTAVDPVIYTSWMYKRLILRDVSVNEIARHIQDYYGYKVILEDTSIGNKKMEGSLLLDDMNDVLFVLSTTLHVKIEKQGTNLIFKNRK